MHSPSSDTYRIEVLREMLADKSSTLETAKQRKSIWIPDIEKQIAALDSAITALSARASAGEGGEWVLVPRKITTDMWRAWEQSYLVSDSYQEDYDAMLTTAPQPAQAGASGGGELIAEMVQSDTQYGGTEVRVCWLGAVPPVGTKLYATPASPATGGERPQCKVTRGVGCEHPNCDCPTTPQPAAAQGEWVMVPRLPTPEMLDAGLMGLSHSGVDNACEADARNAYQYMLAATPPAHGDGEAIPRGVQEALQRMIEDGMVKGDASREDARLVQRWAERLTTRPTPEAQEARDAARWRALVGSARVRVLGSAGLHSSIDHNGEPYDGYAHIGLELWTKHDAPSHPSAVDDLLKYVEIALALPAQGEG